jgi:hypothetical protein
MLFSDSDDDQNVVSDSDEERPPRRLPVFKERIEYREDPKLFRERYRLPIAVFDELLELLQDDLRPTYPANHALNARQKLFVTLRFYASVHFYYSLGDTQGKFESFWRRRWWTKMLQLRSLWYVMRGNL